MLNQHMAIYTKTGDDGTTALFGGKRLSKTADVIEAYGTVDELTSFIGLIVVKLKNKEDKNFLITIQKDLYAIMAFLAGLNKPIVELLPHITLFEQKIDKIQSKLPKLTRFILPGGSKLAAQFHILRVVCRRAERRVVKLKQLTINHELSTSIQYLNRLSDLLFVFARWYGKNSEVQL